MACPSVSETLAGRPRRRTKLLLGKARRARPGCRATSARPARRDGGRDDDARLGALCRRQAERGRPPHQREAERQRCRPRSAQGSSPHAVQRARTLQHAGSRTSASVADRPWARHEPRSSKRLVRHRYSMPARRYRLPCFLLHSRNCWNSRSCSAASAGAATRRLLAPGGGSAGGGCDPALATVACFSFSSATTVAGPSRHVGGQIRRSSTSGDTGGTWNFSKRSK